MRPVTVVLRHNEKLELNLVEYTGLITIDQLHAIADYGAAHPNFLKTDTFNIVHADADFSNVALSDLDALFARYRKYFGALSFNIYRRAVWLCLSPSAEPHIAYWIGDHDLRETMSSAVRKFDSYEDAADWLLLNSTEIAQVERGEGFEVLACFDVARPLVRARSKS